VEAIVRTGVAFGLVTLLLAGSRVGDQTSAAAEGAVGGTRSSFARGPIPAPRFAEKDIFGKSTVALEDYLGKIVLLNFWATWCAPCREEITALKALQASHKGLVAVIGVSVFSSDQDTEQFYKDYGITYPVFYGSFDLMERYDKVAAIPTTFIVDKQGAIAAKVIGSRTREQYEEMLKPLLDR